VPFFTSKYTDYVIKTKESEHMLYAFFWVIPLASEFYMLTFRNTLSVPSS